METGRQQRRRPAGQTPPAGRNYTLWYWIAALIALLGIQYVASLGRQVAPIPYSQFTQLVREGKVAEVGISDRVIQGTLKEPLPDGATQFSTVRVEPNELAPASATPGGSRARCCATSCPWSCRSRCSSASGGS